MTNDDWPLHSRLREPAIQQQIIDSLHKTIDSRDRAISKLRGNNAKLRRILNDIRPALEAALRALDNAKAGK